jgi:hypothetical protein
MILILIILIYLSLFIYLYFLNNIDNFNNKTNKIIVKNIETKVQIINKNDFSNYKKKLDNLYKKCVFSNGIHPNFNLNNSESLVFILRTSSNNEIIGSLQIDDFDKLNKKFYIDSIGAIEDKKGLFLTFLCGNENYKGITEPLFDAVEEYAKNNNFEYILLEAYGNWRKDYYKKFGYKNIIDNNFPSMIKFII